jgi:dihydrofolate synthase / folylpolyglutamate synthase
MRRHVDLLGTGGQADVHSVQAVSPTHRASTVNEEMISHDGPGHRWLARQSSRGVKWQLERVRSLLDRLGNPQKSFVSVVVAGTNGKGSVTSMLAAMLHEAGVKVGHFTSPHFVETRERFRIANRCVTAEQLDEALVAVAEACDWQTDRPDHNKGETPITDEIKATPFEALTAAAMWAGRKHALQVEVLECGLGGRLDATNCADADVAVLTHVGRDHTQSLGETIAEIAAEKVAIGRDGRPMIVAQPSIAVAAAKRVGINPVFRKLATHVVVEKVRISADGMTTEGVLNGPMLGEPLHVNLSLAGAHQMENAALAVMAYVETAAVLRGKDIELPPPIEVVGALAGVTWPGRAEVISNKPLIVVDAAHNESGAAALVELLERRSKRWQVVLAMRNNRKPEAFIRALAPIAQTFWVPRMQSGALHDAQELAKVVDLAAPQAAVAVSSAERCLDHAKMECYAGGGVLVTGSIYGIGELLHRGLIDSPRLKKWLHGD